MSGVGNTVTYGIGVQNRYSAFLDIEDGFGGALVASIAAGQPKSQLSKQKQPDGKSALAANKHSVGLKKLAQKNIIASGKRTLSDKPHNGIQEVVDTKQRSVYNNKEQQGKNNQEDMHNGCIVVRYTRPQVMRGHNSNTRQPALGLREQSGKNGPENYQRMDNRKQFQNGSRARDALPRDSNDTQPIAVPLVAGKDGKIAIQQKHDSDLKLRGPERREERRPMRSKAMEQSNQSPSVQEENGQKRFIRTKRNPTVLKKPSEEEDKLMMRDSKRLTNPKSGSKGIDPNSNDAPTSEEKHQFGSNQFGPAGNRRNIQRPPRKGVGVASKNEKDIASKTFEQARENLKQKSQIPNFSDRLDFPVLA